MSVTAPRTLETKVVMLGHSGVGKTTMLNQFVRGTAPPHSTATIGAAFMKKTMSATTQTIHNIHAQPM